MCVNLGWLRLVGPSPLFISLLCSCLGLSFVRWYLSFVRWYLSFVFCQFPSVDRFQTRVHVSSACLSVCCAGEYVSFVCCSMPFVCSWVWNGFRFELWVDTSLAQLLFLTFVFTTHKCVLIGPFCMPPIFGYWRVSNVYWWVSCTRLFFSGVGARVSSVLCINKSHVCVDTSLLCVGRFKYLLCVGRFRYIPFVYWQGWHVCMQMYWYINIYLYIYIYMYVFTYTYMYVYVYEYTYI